MGILCSCCKGGGGDYEEYTRDRPLSSQQPTAADLEARRAAAEAAAARQAKFDTSAVGKAARKAVDNVRKEREAGAAAAANKDNSRDWLS